MQRLIVLRLMTRLVLFPFSTASVKPYLSLNMIFFISCFLRVLLFYPNPDVIHLDVLAMLCHLEIFQSEVDCLLVCEIVYAVVFPVAIRWIAVHIIMIESCYFLACHNYKFKKLGCKDTKSFHFSVYKFVTCDPLAVLCHYHPANDVHVVLVF